METIVNSTDSITLHIYHAAYIFYSFMYNIHNNITSFLKYLGCSDDYGTMYLVGEQFSTAKNCTCSCNKGYRLSCGQPCSSNESGS